MDYDMVLTYDPSYLGIGTINPASDLHIHSSIVSPVDDSGDGGDSDISTRDIIQLQKSVARLQLTNHETGITEDDGLLIKMYNNNASIYNQESGHLSFISNNINVDGGNLAINDNQIYFRGSDDANHRINYTNENNLDGLHIQGNKGVEIATNFGGTALTVRDGNVGIGTSETDAPVNRLHIKRNSNLYPHDGSTESGNYPHEYSKYTAYIENGGGSGAGLLIQAGSNSDYGYPLLVQNHNNNDDILAVSSSGKVGIGTAEPREKLTVDGTILAEEVIIISDAINGSYPDFVFEDDYNLISLSELENYIESNGHLPEIPKRKEVSENGIKLQEMNVKLLQKVEELTLYTIQQQKAIEELKTKLKELEEE